ncbi:MAG TPA: histidine kinase dimerization/phospho-acceptor domain-containing protein, partial [Candidatus Ozemobacteraceae bacterium]|nr:histidine kinase dimerization/phospho-acceptor domain-containing protein [Candidatus Ozemobacteraceae bacterium]
MTENASRERQESFGSRVLSSRLFLIYTLITFAGLGLLVALTVRALTRQAEIETDISRHGAMQRASKTGLAFARSLIDELPRTPALLLKAPKLPPTPTVFSRLEQSAVFLRLAAADHSERLNLILEEAVSASESEKPFWWLLAVLHQVDLDPSVADLWAQRLLAGGRDWSITGQPSAFTLASLHLARSFARRGSLGSASAWLQRTAQGAPLPHKFDLRHFWGTAPVPAGWADLFALADLLHRSPRPYEPYRGWHLSKEEPKWPSGPRAQEQYLLDFVGSHTAWIVVESDSRTYAVEARHRFSDLYKQILADGDPGFVKTLSWSWDGTQESAALAGDPGLFLTLRKLPSDALHTSRRYALLVAGVALTLGGLLSMLLLFTRREQQAEMRATREDLYRQAAHDLKTPLTTLRALAETLALRRTRDAEQQERYLQALVREVDQAERVVDGMLLAARLEAGSVEPRLEAVALEPLVADLLKSFSPRLEGWKIETHFATVPVLFADVSLMKRVLANLIENVIRHAYQGRELRI